MHSQRLKEPSRTAPWGRRGKARAMQIVRRKLSEIGGTSEIYLLDVRCPRYENKDLGILLKVSSIVFHQ
eukprot:1175657-Prorocentrum_minimum.AAC.2